MVKQKEIKARTVLGDLEADRIVERNTHASGDRDKFAGKINGERS